MALGGLLFVLGFSFVFISFSAFVGAIGEWMFEYQRQITIGLGVVTILVGLAFMGVVPWLQRDFRVHRVPAVGLAAAPLLGVLFGLGWTPCIGPTLTAVLGLATHEATAGRGALLGFAYCLGLGVPFILAGLAWRHMLGTVELGPPAPGLGHPHRRPAAGRGRAAAGDRLVGHAGRRHPRLVLPGLRPRASDAAGRPDATDASPRAASAPGRRRPRPPAMSPVELGRWAWRQLTSMRTALVLLFLLALAAIPGSVVPQEAVDSLRASGWKADHPGLTPIYERLGLFDVYGSPWFAAIYLLLVVSLVGCIVPRSAVYWRAFRAQPPRAPRHLGRMPDHRAYETADAPDDVLDRARTLLRARRYRIRDISGTGLWKRRGTRSRRSVATSARPATCSSTSRCWSCWPDSRSARCSGSRAA